MTKVVPLRNITSDILFNLNDKPNSEENMENFSVNETF